MKKEEIDEMEYDDGLSEKEKEKLRQKYKKEVGKEMECDVCGRVGKFIYMKMDRSLPGMQNAYDYFICECGNMVVD